MSFRSAAAKALLLGCVLGWMMYALAACSGPGAGSGQSSLSADPIIVTNPGSNTVSAYPIDADGNAPTLVTYPNLQSPNAVARDSSGNLYAVNTQSNSITVYAPGSNGAPNPIATISGPDTGLNYPNGIALDRDDNIYVVNAGITPSGIEVDTITVFSAYSNGNATPIEVITGPDTGLSFPSSIALDAAGNIYITNTYNLAASGSVTVYAPGSNGDVAPIRTISGSNTYISTPLGIAVDSSGNVYVTNQQSFFSGPYSGSITVFAAASNGNVSPIEFIGGSCININTGHETDSGLATPQGIAVDDAGYMYVADDGLSGSQPPAVKIFRPNSGICERPVATISGPATHLTQPAGLVLDSRSNIYVSDSYANSVADFPAGQSGDIAPLRLIADPASGIDEPLDIALDSGGNIYIANAGSQDGGFDSITVYPAGSNANVTASATISSGSSHDKTGLNLPDAVAVDSNGFIYAANILAGYNQNGSITMYAPGSNGNVAPVSTLAGPHTGLSGPIGIALDSSNNLYVLNDFSSPSGSITVYPPGFGGDTAPTWAIQGNDSKDQTGFDNPTAIAIDGSYIYVTNEGSVSGFADSVTIYRLGTYGNVAPIATISGPLTQLNLPDGIALDSRGNIYVANEVYFGGCNGLITIYPPGSNGNVAPSRVISGSLTGLADPAGLVVGG